MKKNISAFYLVLIPLFCVCCKDSKSDDETSYKLKTEVSYSVNGSDSMLISLNDTIKAKLGDTLAISIKTNGSNMGLYGSGNFDIKDSGNNKYLCILKGAGTAIIGGLTYDKEASENILINFFVKVSTIKYKYVVIEDPAFVVNVGDENLKSKINAELKNVCPLNIFNYYKLECKTSHCGDLVYITSAKDTINGTFSSSDILKMNDIEMSYNGSVYDFTIEKATASKFAYGYLLKMDLTEKFRAMYPSETINEVSASALAIKN
jgi:hypothetical protein